MTVDALDGDAGPTLAVATVALAHAVALVAVPARPEALLVAGFEASVLLLALAVGALAGWTPRALGAGAVASGLLVAGTWAATAGASTLVVALGLLALVALVSYGLHRYELVALGLVEVADER